MSDHKFERLLSEIRSEKVDDRVVGFPGSDSRLSRKEFA